LNKLGLETHVNNNCWYVGQCIVAIEQSEHIIRHCLYTACLLFTSICTFEYALPYLIASDNFLVDVCHKALPAHSDTMRSIRFYFHKPWVIFGRCRNKKGRTCTFDLEFDTLVYFLLLKLHTRALSIVKHAFRQSSITRSDQTEYILLVTLSTLLQIYDNILYF